MAAFRVGARAVEGRFQGNGGGVASSRNLAAPPKNPPNREEVALRAKPRSNHLVAAAKLRRRAGPSMPLWRVAVFASVALNVATLAVLLHHYAASPHHHHHRHRSIPTAGSEGTLATTARREGTTTTMRRRPASRQSRRTP
ncbi:hypothetical protein GUJ93_ZPchr0452g16389 [Zizania palustris]|uniref:Uncharacterized protein n=1 Tax=Zizania palustris TaxID=103762 RepID=A0A8J5RSS8_ZIZPA|nr:hypothetical protein GUJ93_ZPchr0452g16389 [Zizania palustris]